MCLKSNMLFIRIGYCFSYTGLFKMNGADSDMTHTCVTFIYRIRLSDGMKMFINAALMVR